MVRIHQRTACRILSAAALLGVVCFLVAGCGGGRSGQKTGVVDGTIMYKGKPVTGGSIILYYENGASYPGTLNPADGSFHLPAAPVGKAAVTVNTESLKNAKDMFADTKRAPKDALTPEMQKQMQQMKGQGGGQPTGVYVQIPSKYASKANTTLHWDIHEGENKLGTIELQP